MENMPPVNRSSNSALRSSLKRRFAAKSSTNAMLDDVTSDDDNVASIKSASLQCRYVQVQARILTRVKNKHGGSKFHMLGYFFCLRSLKIYFYMQLCRAYLKMCENLS